MKNTQEVTGGILIPDKIARKIKHYIAWERLCRKLGLPIRKNWKFTHPITITWKEDETDI